MTIMMNSNYISFWEKYTDLAQGTKYNYKIVYRRFEHFLLQQSTFDGGLDFNRLFFVKQSNSFEPIDEEFVLQFLDSLKENGATRATMRYSISAMTHLFTFLKVMKLIDHNPTLNLRNPYSKDVILNRALSEEEVQKVLKASLRLDPFLREYYVMVLLLVTTGLRNQELRMLTWDQVDLEREMIYVVKGQKTNANTVRLTKRLVNELEAYINHPYNQNRFNNGNNHLFTRESGKEMKRKQDLNNCLKKLALEAGVKQFTAHCLRHTMAQLLYDKGVELRCIQRQLRHKLIETTVKYLGTYDMSLLME